MIYHLKAKGLAGLHIGQHVTVKTKHTEASGILQGVNHGAMAINDSTLTGDHWVLGATTATITLLPDQRIIAEMMDEVEVHGDTAPEPAGPQGWEVGDTAMYCCMADGKHAYMSPESAERLGIQGKPVTIVDR